MTPHAPHWSLALSNDKGHILFYRSNLPTEDGVDHGEKIASDTPMWDAVLERDALALAWANCWSTGEAQNLICHAKRNGRRVELDLFLVPFDGVITMASHGIWSRTHESLSQLELDVGAMLARGMTPQEIANELEVSVSTVSRARSEAMRKLECRTGEQLGTRFC
jgi:DNA-binding CsgD family transcriptional regulator